MVEIWKNLWEFLFEPLFALNGCGSSDEENAAQSESSSSSSSTETASETTTTDQATPVGDPLVIGSLLPLTGLYGLGDEIVKGVQLAVEQVNNAGGINGQDVQLIQRDSGADADIAEDSLSVLIEEGVQAIVGPASSYVAKSIIDRAMAAEVVLVSPSVTSHTITKIDNGGFFARTCPSEVLQGKALASLLQEDGIKSISIIAGADDYSRAMAKTIELAFVNVDTIVYHATDATNYDTEVTAVGRDSPDAIVGVLFPNTACGILPEAKEQGLLDRPWYFTDGMYSVSPSQCGLDNGDFDGFKVTAPGGHTGDSRDQFNTAFIYKFGKNPGAWAAQAYDAAMLIMISAAANGVTGTEIASGLQGASSGGTKCIGTNCIAAAADGVDVDYVGASGEIELDDNGDPTAGTYNILSWDGNNFTKDKAVDFGRSLTKKRNLSEDENEKKYVELIKQKNYDQIINIYKDDGQWINFDFTFNKEYKKYDLLKGTIDLYQEYFPFNYRVNIFNYFYRFYKDKTKLTINKFTTIYKSFYKSNAYKNYLNDPTDPDKINFMLNIMNNPFYKVNSIQNIPFYIECGTIPSNSIEIKESGIKTALSALKSIETTLTNIISIFNKVDTFFADFLNINMSGIIAQLNIGLQSVKKNRKELEILINTPLKHEEKDETYRFSKYQKKFVDDDSINTFIFNSQPYWRIIFWSLYREYEEILFNKSTKKYESVPSDPDTKIDESKYRITGFKQSVYCPNKITPVDQKTIQQYNINLFEKVYIISPEKVVKLEFNMLEINAIIDSLLGQNIIQNAITVLKIVDTLTNSFLDTKDILESLQSMNSLLKNLKGGVNILNDFDNLIKNINEKSKKQQPKKQEPKKQELKKQEPKKQNKNLNIQNVFKKYIRLRKSMKLNNIFRLYNTKKLIKMKMT